MGLFRRKKKPVLSRRESLESVVVKSEGVKEETAESGDVTLTVSRRRDSLAARFLMRFFGLPEKRKIILDERGSFIWRCCDGRVTVEEMIERFCGRYKVSRKEAEVSIVYFIKSLAKRGLAGVVVKRMNHDR